MDEQQQQRVNQAAQEFADALRESYQALSERGESAQELNAQLTEQFFNTVNDHLRTHAEDTRQMSEQLADHQQRGQEATQQLTQESVNAYMDFINSMFSYLPGGRL
jgi:predicted ATP-dependent endonuclease of OLD family